MARTPVLDELLSHEFHLIDVDIQPPFLPPLVLWPTAGFSSITAPEMTAETTTIVEGTSDYTYAVLSRSSMSPMTLSKGVSMFNTDFWRWMLGAVSGKNDSEIVFSPSIGPPTPPIPPARRRNLMLIQSSGISVKGLMEIMKIGSMKEKLLATTLLPSAGLTAASSAAISLLSQGTFDLNLLGIPGRAYMLFDCLPIRFKAAGDFEANATTVSIEELEISYTRFELMGGLG